MLVSYNNPLDQVGSPEIIHEDEQRLGVSKSIIAQLINKADLRVLKYRMREEFFQDRKEFVEQIGICEEKLIKGYMPAPDLASVSKSRLSGRADACGAAAAAEARL